MASSCPAPREPAQKNGRTIQASEILDLLENGDLSDVDDIISDDDEDVLGYPEQPTSRQRIGHDRDCGRQDPQNVEPTDRQTDEEDLEEEDELLEQGDGSRPFSGIITDKKKIKWRKRNFVTPDIDWQPSELSDSNDVLTPIEYFSKYIKPEDFEKLAQCTSIYALQKNVTNFKPTTSHEIQVLFGLHVAIGCLKFPRVRLFWDTSLGINMFLDNMTRDRFFQLRSNLHIVNNLERPEGCRDKLFKVRPLFDAVRNRCLQLEMEEELSIDEQMVPFRGRISIKQYVKGKPNPWGFKIFLICGKNGELYDLVLYQGSTTELDGMHLKSFGLGASVVLHLCKRIEKPGHKLFYDNYFSSYHLLQILKEKQIFAAGTCRINRFANPPVSSDAEAKKKGRGYSEQLVSLDGDVVLVKWQDNRSVVLASNFIGIGEEDNVRRWDKSTNSYIEVKRPEIVKRYNHAMGGVDLMDQLVSLYRIFIRSKKWSLRMIFHAVDLAICNSWLEYRKDFRLAGLQKKDEMDLLHFRMRVAEALIKVGKNVNGKKRGRPSSSPMISPSNAKRRGEKRPAKEIQLDYTDHMPQHDHKKEAGRCKMPNCKGRSHLICDKCKIHLCLNKERNCFARFHRK